MYPISIYWIPCGCGLRATVWNYNTISYYHLIFRNTYRFLFPIVWCFPRLLKLFVSIYEYYFIEVWLWQLDCRVFFSVENKQLVSRGNSFDGHVKISQVFLKIGEYDDLWYKLDWNFPFSPLAGPMAIAPILKLNSFF